MLEIGENALLAPDVYEMTLVGDASAITAPGQFINIRLDGLYLRRPISVCDWGEGWDPRHLQGGGQGHRANGANDAWPKAGCAHRPG